MAEETTIKSVIDSLTASRDAIAQATRENGVEVPEGTKLADLAPFVSSIGSKTPIVLDDESTAADIEEAIEAHRTTGRNVVWTTNSANYGTIAGYKSTSPKAIYFIMIAPNVGSVLIEVVADDSLESKYSIIGRFCSGEEIRAIDTAEKMDGILANATSFDVGAYYMYVGETTDKYTKGAVYKVKEV